MLGVQNTAYYRISGAQSSGCHCSSDGGRKIDEQNELQKNIQGQSRIVQTDYFIILKQKL